MSESLKDPPYDPTLACYHDAEGEWRCPGDGHGGHATHCPLVNPETRAAYERVGARLPGRL